MLMALQPAISPRPSSGMKQLAKNGLRYPIAPYGFRPTFAPAWAFPTRRSKDRHCERCEAIHFFFLW
jgi:hypothetical protein